MTRVPAGTRMALDCGSLMVIRMVVRDGVALGLSCTGYSSPRPSRFSPSARLGMFWFPI